MSHQTISSHNRFDLVSELNDGSDGAVAHRDGTVINSRVKCLLVLQPECLFLLCLVAAADCPQPLLLLLTTCKQPRLVDCLTTVHRSPATATPYYAAILRSTMTAEDKISIMNSLFRYSQQHCAIMAHSHKTSTANVSHKEDAALTN